MTRLCNSTICPHSPCPIQVLHAQNPLIIDVDHLGQLNTPANDRWELALLTTSLSAVDPNVTFIIFLSNGSIDTSLTLPDDLAYANDVLSAAKSALDSRTNTEVNILELVNWMYVSIYWTMLFDLGQLFPVIYYPWLNEEPTTYLSTNNIFMNPTLFDIYYSYLNNTVMPLLGINTNVSELDIPWFDDPTAENSLQVSNTTFIRSYSCVERHWKSWLEMIISVIVADYALIGAPYAIVIFLAVQIQKRRHRDCKLSISRC